MEKKIFGSSMIDKTRLEPYSEDGQGRIPTEEEVAKDRAELIESDPNIRVVDKVSTDAMSGVTISSRITPEEQLATIEELLDKGDVTGRSLPAAALKYISDSTGVSFSKEDAERVAKFFEAKRIELSNITHNAFDDIPIEEINDALGSEIVTVIKALATDDDDYSDIARRLIGQIFSKYDTSVECTDHMKDLASILRKIKDNAEEGKKLKAEREANGIEDITEDAKSMDNLTSTYGHISDWLAMSQTLDSRNKRLRADYSIDDIDTKTIKNVRDALYDALRMSSIGSFVSKNKERMAIEFKNSNDRIAIIKNWITALKKDKHVMYVFPANDYESVGSTLIIVRDYIFNAIIMDEFKTVQVPISEKNPKDYFLENGICDQNTVDEFLIKSELILYTLARVFRPKILLENYYQRVLSYTLDMLSKLGRDDYRERFHDLGNYLYGTLFK